MATQEDSAASQELVFKAPAMLGALAGLSRVTGEDWALSCLRPGMERRGGAGRKEGWCLGGGQSDLEDGSMSSAQK